MKKCPICNLVTVLAGVGALNWLLVTWLNLDLVARFLGGIPAAAKAVYTLVGIAGALLLVSLVKPCPCGCKTS